MRKHVLRATASLALTAVLTAGATACSDSGDDTSDRSAATPTAAASEKRSEPAAASEPASEPAAPSEPAADAGREDIDAAALAYVDAVGSEDLEALVDAFHTDAELIDVSRTFNGHDEIRDWASGEVIGGKLTVLKSTPKDNGTTLLVRFAPGGSGGFEANYEFDVRDGRIEKLNLQYA